MAVITPEKNNYFKSTSFVYSKVRRDFSSFDAAGLIDEGEFAEYTKHVLKTLGLGIYRESDAVMEVKNYKAKLPTDFSQLYAAYKCTPFVGSGDIAHLQGQPVSVFNDVTWELLQGNSNCTIETANDDLKVIEKITVRQFVKETPIVINFKNPVLLALSPNVNRERCTEDCKNLLCTNINEITITDGFLYTNFTKDCIYMKYYAFPLDEDGLPLIPDVERVERAIEWCIKYNLLYNWWFNNSVPDLQNRWQAAQLEYEKWLAESKRELQMPYFSQMVNNIRKNRAINKINILTPRYM
jgi:hypothetical protein